LPCTRVLPLPGYLWFAVSGSQLATPYHTGFYHHVHTLVTGLPPTPPPVAAAWFTHCHAVPLPVRLLPRTPHTVPVLRFPLHSSHHGFYTWLRCPPTVPARSSSRLRIVAGYRFTCLTPLVVGLVPTFTFAVTHCGSFTHTATGCVCDTACNINARSLQHSSLPTPAWVLAPVPYRSVLQFCLLSQFYAFPHPRTTTACLPRTHRPLTLSTYGTHTRFATCRSWLLPPHTTSTRAATWMRWFAVLPTPPLDCRACLPYLVLDYAYLGLRHYHTVLVAPVAVHLLLPTAVLDYTPPRGLLHRLRGYGSGSTPVTYTGYRARLRLRARARFPTYVTHARLYGYTVLYYWFYHHLVPYLTRRLQFPARIHLLVRCRFTRTARAITTFWTTYCIFWFYAHWICFGFAQHAHLTQSHHAPAYHLHISIIFCASGRAGRPRALRTPRCAITACIFAARAWLPSPQRATVLHPHAPARMNNLTRNALLRARVATTRGRRKRPLSRLLLTSLLPHATLPANSNAFVSYRIAPYYFFSLPVPPLLPAITFQTT